MSKRSETECMADLLEYLQQRANCNYLSDLHEPRWASKVQGALRSISDDQFPLSAWKEVIRYILGHDADVATAAEARLYLIHQLEPT